MTNSKDKQGEKKMDVHKVLIKAVEAGIKSGMHYQAKVWLRCQVEGCRYGIEGIDKYPLEKCMYCGEPNMSEFYKRFIKPIK